MLSANSRKENQKLAIEDGLILNHSLSFLNTREIAGLRQLNTQWQTYVENQLFLFKPNTNQLLQPYLKDFKVYRHEEEYLVHFDIKKLCQKNSAKLFKELPFIKLCLSKACGSLIHIHLTMWSPDGINFILLYPDQSCKTNAGRIIKAPGLQQPCLLEFSPHNAVLHQLSPDMITLNEQHSDSDATDESDEYSEESLDFNPLDIQKLYSLPDHKKHSTKIRHFERCEPGTSKLILAGLTHNKLPLHFIDKDNAKYLNPLDHENLNYDDYALRHRWPG